MSTKHNPHLIILMLLYIKTASDSDFFLSCLTKHAILLIFTGGNIKHDISQ